MKESVKNLVKNIKDSGENSVFLIPSVQSKKLEIVEKMVKATKQANIPNVLFPSSAGYI